MAPVEGGEAVAPATGVSFKERRSAGTRFDGEVLVAVRAERPKQGSRELRHIGHAVLLTYHEKVRPSSLLKEKVRAWSADAAVFESERAALLVEERTEEAVRLGWLGMSHGRAEDQSRDAKEAS